MNLLDRFSTHLRDVLAQSIHLSVELRHLEVEPIHLFFTLLNQKGSIAAEIMRRFKITPSLVEDAILTLPVRSERPNITARNPTELVLTPLSNNAKLTLEKAMTIAEENRHNYIGTEHLLAALIFLNDRRIDNVLTTQKIDRNDLNQQLATVLANASHFPHLSDVGDIIEHFEEHAEAATPVDQFEPIKEIKKGRKKDSALDFFAANLTDPKTQKTIDPVIGREKEIERVIQILCRRTKNNPLLLGEPGVGKTAIVEGLAKKILAGEVPDLLLNKKIYSLDLGLLIAGTIYRGEFEARLRQVVDEVIHNSSIILFIDELHNIVGAGANQGAMDAANLLKPALSRGQIRCIGATTPQEYKKYIENDAALERRFQPIIAKEPSADDTIKILSGIKENYELYHRVTITHPAIVAAVRLSERYITNKFLPDKAIDLLDETAAAKRLSVKRNGASTKLFRLEQQLEKTILAKESAAADDHFNEAVELKKQEEALRADIKKATTASGEEKITKLGTVTERDIAEQVAKITGTSPAELLLDDATSLTTIENRLKHYIVGQDEVIAQVSRHIRQAKLGLSNPDRPLASFLFVGESGIGKTELAKSIALALYSNPDALIKLDMSEFNESFGVSKLLGSPAGYVGYKETNHFTDKIKMNPYSVVLFDEIDKAHRDIVKLLLQILENGVITDSTGKKISLKHAILILTTSLGAADMKKGLLGFGGSATTKIETRTRAIEKLKDYFSVEVINRLDQICFFEPLTEASLTAIAGLELARFNDQLKPYHTTVSSDKKVLEWVVGQLNTKNGGAREVRQYIRGHIENLISNIILRGKIKKKYALTIGEKALALK
ncbi:MAG: ATP-dependent Clp protease ATP-binding subunit [Candidatus Magasanikbacteria bacterium]|nr:ATP-dependent Clp protease ATP-binding subunit [Candidatus Magasanikbacteria bacterium]